jgi:RND family efflux transporter MFP subunit
MLDIRSRKSSIENTDKKKLEIIKEIKMKNKILLAVLIFSFAAYFGCSSKKEQKTNDVIPVKVMKLKKEKIHRAINISGIFTTNDETYLSFKTGGIVKSIFVNEGDRVKKGQILAVLELNEIKAQVSQAKAGYEKALRDFNRAQNLYKDSVATLAQMEDAKTGLNIATEQLTIAKYNLNHSEIRATDDGYVLKKFVNEGQLVSPGMPVFQTNGAVKDGWILKAGISDHDWSIVKRGDKALVKSDINPDVNIKAYVLRKSEGVDPYSGTFYVELRIKDDRSGKIASGLFGKAEIFPEFTSKMWSAPYQSILDGDGNTGYVFATNNMKTAEKVKVNIFALEEDSVYINQGLDNYKYLIVSGSAYLNNNSPIKIDSK